MKVGNNKRAIELFKHAQEAIPFQQVPHLSVISLVRSLLSEFLNDHTRLFERYSDGILIDFLLQFSYS